MGIVIQFLWIPNRFLSHFIRSVACLGFFSRFLFQSLPFLSSLYLPLCLVLSLYLLNRSAMNFFGQSGACCVHRKQEEERTQVKDKGGSCRAWFAAGRGSMPFKEPQMEVPMKNRISLLHRQMPKKNSFLFHRLLYFLWIPFILEISIFFFFGTLISFSNFRPV